MEELTVAYGDRSVVDGVSFEVQAGEVVALLGPNGAGKTTTVETLEGYRRPRSGRLRVLGIDPVRQRAELVRRIGVVLQAGGVYPVMSPRRALSLYASYYEEPRDPEELIGLLQLGAVASTPFKRLSGGERQRLLLALALVGRPEICFLDEPTAGVDPAGRVAVRDVIAGLREDGVSILVTSHELDEVERVADRVIVLHHGRILAEGPQGEIGGEEMVRFSVSGHLDAAALGARLGRGVVEEGPGTFRVEGDPSPEIVAAVTSFLAQHGLILSDLRVGHERLEDVFLRLVSEESEAR